MKKYTRIGEMCIKRGPDDDGVFVFNSPEIIGDHRVYVNKMFPLNIWNVPRFGRQFDSGYRFRPQRTIGLKYDLWNTFI